MSTFHQTSSDYGSEHTDIRQIFEASKEVEVEITLRFTARRIRQVDVQPLCPAPSLERFSYSNWNDRRFLHVSCNARQSVLPAVSTLRIESTLQDADKLSLSKTKVPRSWSRKLIDEYIKVLFFLHPVERPSSVQLTQAMGANTSKLLWHQRDSVCLTHLGFKALIHGFADIEASVLVLLQKMRERPIFQHKCKRGK